MRSFEPSTWRLLTTPPAGGSWNMAVDESILEAIGRREAPPTLRQYAWEPPCLSLGYAQQITDVDYARLEARGWQVVRRLTGGRAILHTDELTYSVIVPVDEPRLAGGVLESYQVVAGALLEALRRLSIPAESKQHPDLPAEYTSPGPVCFDVPSNYEITVNGKKLLGSAQARRREGILQHGTLPLHGDLTRIVDVLSYASQGERSAAAERLNQRGTTLEKVLGYPPVWQTVAGAFSSSFQDVLNLSLQPGGLSPAELTRAEQLALEKYGNPNWNARR